MPVPGEGLGDIARLIGGSLGLELWGAEPLGQGQRRTFRCHLGNEIVVVKWGLDPDLAEKIPYVAGQVDELNRRGCQVPAIIAHGRLRHHGYAWLQENLPGVPATALDNALLSDLVELTYRWAHAPDGFHRSDYRLWVPAVVFHDAAGWWATARAAGSAVEEFCRRLRAWVGAPVTPRAAHDYVHGDLNLQNILISQDGRLTGLVDLENLGVGNQGVDVARLLFEWHRLARVTQPGLPDADPALLVALGRELAGEAGWRQAVAYELISRLGWRSEHQPDVEVDAVLPICVELLDSVGR